MGCLWVSWSHHFESLRVDPMTLLKATEYLFHKWPRICSICRSHITAIQHSWIIIGFLTRVTRRLSLVEQELLALPEYLRVSSDIVIATTEQLRPEIFLGCNNSNVTEGIVLKHSFFYLKKNNIGTEMKTKVELLSMLSNQNTSLEHKCLSSRHVFQMDELSNVQIIFTRSITSLYYNKILFHHVNPDANYKVFLSFWLFKILSQLRNIILCMQQFVWQYTVKAV